MTDKETIELLDSTIAKLSEHFDHVQIHLSWNHEGGTKIIHRGSGNWYARQGMAHEFIQKDIASENAKQLADIIKPDLL